MSNNKTRVSVKDMSDDDKKEHKRKQMREYMAKRKLQDPEFLEKQREYNRNRQKKREYNPANSQYHRDYYRKRRDELISLREKVAILESQ